MWVRSEYANELAVLAAWVSVFIPWSGARVTREYGVDPGPFTTQNTVSFFRFPFFGIQVRRAPPVDPSREGGVAINGSLRERVKGADASSQLDADYAGTELIDNVFVTTPFSSVSFYDGGLQQPSLLWLGASLAIGAALVLSLALYFREERVADRLPLSPVRTMGVLLGLGTLGTAGASVLYYTQRDVAGFPIPVGVVLLGVLAAVLLQTEEVDNPASEGDPEDS